MAAVPCDVDVRASAVEALCDIAADGSARGRRGWVPAGGGEASREVVDVEAAVGGANDPHGRFPRVARGRGGRVVASVVEPLVDVRRELVGERHAGADLSSAETGAGEVRGRLRVECRDVVQRRQTLDHSRLDITQQIRGVGLVVAEQRHPGRDEPAPQDTPALVAGVCTVPPPSAADPHVAGEHARGRLVRLAEQPGEHVQLGAGDGGLPLGDVARNDRGEGEPRPVRERDGLWLLVMAGVLGGNGPAGHVGLRRGACRTECNSYRPDATRS